ncbi:LysR family transcriptional regulator [Tianweitania sediminis]|uniref:LysR family transcriptional regulator n=1 Tax=Tianweitania sediminis TaxID=1502156 RepID=UPI0036069D1E
MRSPVHLNAMRAFEASARHGSFSGAGKELNVTAAAVGQMVRSLEEWLQMPVDPSTIQIEIPSFGGDGGGIPHFELPPLGG